MAKWTIEQFKSACLAEDELTDDKVEAIMNDVVFNSEEDVKEFCAILHKYRPALEKKLAKKLPRRITEKTVLKSVSEIPPEVQETFKKLMKNLDEGLPHPRDHIR